MKKRKSIIIAAALLLLAVPALAVFNEKDLSRTLSVLRFELSQEHERQVTRSQRIDAVYKAQRLKMVQTIKKCNELSLMLYSQNQDCTLDMTYALGEVTKEYESFNSHRMPYDEIVQRLDLEIDRYSRLIESLRRLPPEMKKVNGLPDNLAYHNDSLMTAIRRNRIGWTAPSKATTPADDSLRLQRMSAFVLDKQGITDRDTCIAYAIALLKMYSESRERIIKDSDHYEELNLRLKESYEYAQGRYRQLQHKMFTKGLDNYFRVLKTFPRYSQRAIDDAKEKYTRTYSVGGTRFYSEWRGPFVAGFIGVVLLYLLAAALLTIIVLAILKPFCKFMRTNDFKARKPAIVILSSLILFIIGIWVLPHWLEDNKNFFKMSSGLLLLFAWLSSILMLSLLVRLKSSSVRPAIKLYLPIIVLSLLVITMRIVFFPNRMMNMLIPPVALLTFIWQIIVYRKYLSKVEVSDRIVSGISLGVLFIMTLMSWVGYVFLSIQVVIWWMFQLSGISTVTALFSLLKFYEDRFLSRRLGMSYSALDKKSTIKKGEVIGITWFHDLLDMAIFPILAVLTVPLSLRLALGVFDLSEMYSTIVNYSLVNLTDKTGAPIMTITIHNLLTVICMFFVFKFVNYLVRSLYTNYRLMVARHKEGSYEMHAGQINFTLSNNIIAILVWGTYIAVCVIILRIPIGALSIVAAGLATGLGLAMKDILNNFIYGIQLMSGRVRVGDWVECDGIRGKVASITYQSTQLETIDGAIMSVLNTSLFNKNFKNLTRNNPYEFVRIDVGVAYGTEVEKAREVILEALAHYNEHDRYGRPAVDPTRPINVVVDNFGDSSVDLAVKLYVLVSMRYTYLAAAKEMIYAAFADNGVKIPFPQRDIHIIPNEDE